MEYKYYEWHLKPKNGWSDGNLPELDTTVEYVTYGYNSGEQHRIGKMAKDCCGVYFYYAQGHCISRDIAAWRYVKNIIDIFDNV